MSGGAWKSASKLLRRPALVVGEVAGLATSIALAATVPQEADGAAVGEFAERWPILARATRALGLHAILTSGWFLALVALATLSLVAVQLEQWKRVRRTWGAPLDPASFARAPLRRELPLAGGRALPAPRFRRSGRVGLLGSPIFHLGLLVVVAAGLARLLLFSDAGAVVLEGETLAPEPAAWQVQQGGPLSRPFSVPVPLRLDEVRPARYPSGALRQVTARLSLGEQGTRDISINAPVEVEGRSIYILQGHGPAALLERRSASGEVSPAVVYLEQRDQDYRGRLLLGDGREVRLRAAVTADRLEVLEARLLEGPVLRTVAQLGPGAELPLGGGEALRLVGLPWWARLWGSRDPSRPFFFAGVAIAIAGIVLLFGFVPVDSAVFAEGGRVVVALRPQRFAPLFVERFEQACKEWQA